MATKLSPRLKQIISVRHDPIPGPGTHILYPLFETFAKESRTHQVGQQPWMVLATGTFFSLNSPSSLRTLSSYLSSPSFSSLSSSSPESKEIKLDRLALLRESGLKTISFIGIAKVINNLGELTTSFDPELAKELPSSPKRQISTATELSQSAERGNNLWSSIYTPYDKKLLNKLASYHPDLPVHIVNSHYGPLLSDPVPYTTSSTLGRVGRVLTSCLAIAALRSLGGVGPQLTSHVFGLAKAANEQDNIDPVRDENLGQNWKWLTTDDGLAWVLHVVDRLIAAVEAHHPRSSKL